MSIAARIDDVVEQAKSQTGLDNFGGDSWRAGLEVLVGAAETEATFNEYGEQAFYGSLVRPLVNRLQIEDWSTAASRDRRAGRPRRAPGCRVSSRPARPRCRTCSPRTARSGTSVCGRSTSPCPPPGVSPGGRRGRASPGPRPRWSPWGETTWPHGCARCCRSHRPGRWKTTTSWRSSSPRRRSSSPRTSRRTPIGSRNCDMEPTYRYEKRVLKLLQWKTTGEALAAQEPDAHHVPRRVRAGLPGGSVRADAPRRVERASVGVGPLLLDAPRREPGIDPLYVGTLNMDQWGIALDRCSRSGPTPPATRSSSTWASPSSRPIRSRRSASSTDGSATSSPRTR